MLSKNHKEPPKVAQLAIKSPNLVTLVGVTLQNKLSHFIATKKKFYRFRPRLFFAASRV
jgi:hypothetical protein